MEEIEQELMSTLKQRFTDAAVEFDHEPGERISGIIISPDFHDMDHEARQAAVWALLRAHLTAEQRKQVLGFLSYTPEEFKIYSEAYDEVE